MASLSSELGAGTVRRRWAIVSLCLVAALLASSCSETSASRSRFSTTTTTGPERSEPLIPPEFLEGSAGSGDVFSFTETLERGLGSLTTVVAPEDLAAIAVGPGALDYLNIYEDLKEASYSVGYKVQGEIVASVPGAVSFSIVHEPARVKNTAVTDDAIATMVVQDGDAVTTCVKFGTWTCEPAKAGTEAFGADVFLLLLGVIAETPGAFDVENYTTTVVGVPVRCLKGTPVSSAASSTGLSSPIEVCVTGEGVPLRVAIPTLTLEGVWYRPSVAPGEFDLPA